MFHATTDIAELDEKIRETERILAQMKVKREKMVHDNNEMKKLIAKIRKEKAK